MCVDTGISYPALRQVQGSGKRPDQRARGFQFLEIYESHNRALNATGPAGKTSEQHVGH
jgi:hypothetical protein